jgi:hypothetical protein
MTAGCPNGLGKSLLRVRSDAVSAHLHPASGLVPAIRGTDGPTRGNVKGTVEPLGDGERSRVTIALDLEGHGIGKILLPLDVRRQAQAEMPRNMQKLKEQLELGA